MIDRKVNHFTLVLETCIIFQGVKSEFCRNTSFCLYCGLEVKNIFVFIVMSHSKTPKTKSVVKISLRNLF